MFLSVYLFWLLLFVGGALLAVFLFILIGVAWSGLPSLGFGRVPLNCPHCGAETPATEAECQHCRRSFREESTVHRPVIDCPKVPARR